MLTIVILPCCVQVVASVAKMFESRRLDGPVQKMYTPSPATRNADAAGLLQVNVADAARKAASVQQFPEQGARETRSDFDMQKDQTTGAKESHWP